MVRSTLPCNGSKICALVSRMFSALFAYPAAPDHAAVVPVAPPPSSFERRFFTSAARSLRCGRCAPVSWEDARWRLALEGAAAPRPGVALHLPQACLRCGAGLGGLVRRPH